MKKILSYVLLVILVTTQYLRIDVMASNKITDFTNYCRQEKKKFNNKEIGTLDNLEKNNSLEEDDNIIININKDGKDNIQIEVNQDDQLDNNDIHNSIEQRPLIPLNKCIQNNNIEVEKDIKEEKQKLDLKVIDKTDTTIQLGWRSNEGEFSYEIYRNEMKIDEVTQTSYQDIQLSTDTEYSYIVKEVDKDDLVNSVSNKIIIKTKAGLHKQNTRILDKINILPLKVTDNSIYLLWTMDEITRQQNLTYKIYMDEILLEELNDNYYKVIELESNIKYNFFVEVRNEKEELIGISNHIEVTTKKNLMHSYSYEYVIGKIMKYYPELEIIEPNIIKEFLCMKPIAIREKVFNGDIPKNICPKTLLQIADYMTLGKLNGRNWLDLIEQKTEIENDNNKMHNNETQSDQQKNKLEPSMESLQLRKINLKIIDEGIDYNNDISVLVEYNSDKLQLIDLCSMTENEEIEIGLIYNTDINIVYCEPGIIIFKIDKAMHDNRKPNDLINCIKFTEKESSGILTVKYSIYYDNKKKN